MITDPTFYNLHSRTRLVALSENELTLVKLIKSRIILKDAIKIVGQIEQIKIIAPALELSLTCTRNICSKSLALLSAKGIAIHYSERE